MMRILITTNLPHSRDKILPVRHRGDSAKHELSLLPRLGERKPLCVKVFRPVNIGLKNKRVPKIEIDFH